MAVSRGEQLPERAADVGAARRAERGDEHVGRAGERPRREQCAPVAEERMAEEEPVQKADRAFEDDHRCDGVHQVRELAADVAQGHVAAGDDRFGVGRRAARKEEDRSCDGEQGDAAHRLGDGPEAAGEDVGEGEDERAERVDAGCPDHPVACELDDPGEAEHGGRRRVDGARGQHFPPRRERSQDAGERECLKRGEQGRRKHHGQAERPLAAERDPCGEQRCQGRQHPARQREVEVADEEHRRSARCQRGRIDERVGAPVAPVAQRERDGDAVGRKRADAAGERLDAEFECRGSVQGRVLLFARRGGGAFRLRQR